MQSNLLILMIAVIQYIRHEGETANNVRIRTLLNSICIEVSQLIECQTLVNSFVREELRSLREDPESGMSA